MKFFLSEFDTLLMYINLRTRSHIFLKISIFCKKIITFSSSAHLMKKSTFLPKFQFFRTKLTLFAPKLIMTETLSLCLKVCTTLFYQMNLEIHSFAKKLTPFCIKCYFLPKENNATKNWHFSKTEDTSLRILNISIKN